MKIAVLGARGTIGAVLAQHLSQQHNVTAVTRDQVDLLDTQAVRQYFNQKTFDVVVNAAINSVNGISAPPQVNSDNLTLFMNLYEHRHSFGRVIHFCSGAEFDISQDISNTKEDHLFDSRPIDPYGASKNATARLSYNTDNFYNLRIFGIFYPTELRTRLLPLILSGRNVTIKDRYFDYLWLEDLIPVVDYYVNTATPRHKDINVVYPEKSRLSDFVRRFRSEEHTSELQSH